MASISNYLKNKSKNDCESRETSYVKFMSSIPRLCSPTICGTANYKTPKNKRHEEKEWSFNWSIEQMALLNPCDFSNTEEFNNFREIDEQIVCKQLDAENDEFFSQNQIIPSPKTPKKSSKLMTQISEESFDSKGSPICRSDKTPDYQNISKDSLVMNSLKTPLNCSKSRQKKKLFEDEHYLLESVANSSRTVNDSVIDSQSLFSPIYSPNWRNTSLSNRITYLSPIRCKNQIDVDLDFDNENSICDTEMKTEIASHSNMTSHMMSIESQTDRPNSRSSICNYLDDDFDNDFQILCNNNNFYDHCDHRLLQRFHTKTSTPSHL